MLMDLGTFGDPLGRDPNLMAIFSDRVSLPDVSKSDLVAPTHGIDQGNAQLVDGHHVALLKVTQRDRYIIAIINADRRNNVVDLWNLVIPVQWNTGVLAL